VSTSPIQLSYLDSRQILHALVRCGFRRDSYENFTASKDANVLNFRYVLTIQMWSACRVGPKPFLKTSSSLCRPISPSAFLCCFDNKLKLAYPWKTLREVDMSHGKTFRQRMVTGLMQLRRPGAGSGSISAIHLALYLRKPSLDIKGSVTAPTWPFTEPLDPGGCAITTGPCMY
jgi:hypothetical protein